MLKRLAPILSVLICFMLDTAVIPMLYGGIYLIPLSLLAVIAIAIHLGRMRGMLYGMIAGLLLDITTGNLGLKLFPYILFGFLIGFLLDQQKTPSRSMKKSERFAIVAIRGVWIFVLYAIYEIVMLIYQYFSTAVFEWVYVRNLLLRALLFMTLSLLLHGLFRRIYIGRKARNDARFREVKHF